MYYGTDYSKGSNTLVVALRSCMKSKTKPNGLKVRFESLPSPDMFSNEEPDVPGSGVQSPRCGQVRNLLVSLGALRLWTTMKRTRWGLLKVMEMVKLRARYGS